MIPVHKVLVRWDIVWLQTPDSSDGLKETGMSGLRIFSVGMKFFLMRLTSDSNFANFWLCKRTEIKIGVY